MTTPKELVSTAYWARSTGMLAEMAKRDRADEAPSAEALRDAIGEAFARAFVRRRRRIGNDSQTSHILGPAVRPDPAGPAQTASATRPGRRHRPARAKLSTGFIGTPYILDALADHGHEDIAYGLLLQTELPSWGYQVDQGATTVFERWDGLKDGVVTGSLNHYAFGAVCGFIWRRIIGIAAT
jgi:alpha-L-rhamnosidase